MSKKAPFEEPLTPGETAEVRSAVETSLAKMRVNGARLIKEALRRAWIDPDVEPAACPLSDQPSRMTASAENPK